MATYKGREVSLLGDVEQAVEQVHIHHKDGIHEVVKKAEVLLSKEERAKEVEKLEKKLAELKAKYAPAKSEVKPLLPKPLTK